LRIDKTEVNELLHVTNKEWLRHSAEYSAAEGPERGT